MKKICMYCKVEFETNNKTKRCCTRHCSQKLLWSDSEYKEKMCKKNKEVHNRPEVKEKHSKVMKLYYKNNPEAIERYSLISKEIQSRPDVKEKKSKFMKDFQNRPEVKRVISKKVKEYQNRPDIKQKNIEQATYHQNLPEIKQKSSERQKKRMIEDIEYKNKQCKILSDYVKGDKFRKEQSLRMIELWKTDSYVNNKNKGYFKTKEYILPSGKKVKIQGYENLYLDFYFKNGGKEEDISIGKKDIKEKIGIITYIQNGKTHRYFPDFYINSTNTIIEVKSKWTYENDIENIQFKQQGCLDKRFNFELIIY